MFWQFLRRSVLLAKVCLIRIPGEAPELALGMPEKWFTSSYHGLFSFVAFLVSSVLLFSVFSS